MANCYHFIAFALAFGASLAAPVSAPAQPLTVKSEECRLLERYQPEPGQDPTYQPGKDVHGRSVAPAEVDNHYRLDLPETYEFDVEVRPRESGVLSDSRIKVGRVSVSPEGEVQWNGRSLTSPRRAALLDLCRERN